MKKKLLVQKGKKEIANKVFDSQYIFDLSKSGKRTARIAKYLMKETLNWL